MTLISVHHSAEPDWLFSLTTWLRLQDHEASKGALRPRQLYLYRSVQGWEKLATPKPYRPSKYLRFSGPRIIVDSFDLASAASLLSSLARSTRRPDEKLLAAIERLVIAALPLPSSRPAGAATALGDAAAAPSVSLAGAAILPGTPGALAASVGGRLVPIDPAAFDGFQRHGSIGAPIVGGATGASMPSVAAGTARHKIGASAAASASEATGELLDKRTAGRLLRGFYDLKYRYELKYMYDLKYRLGASPRRVKP